jgi:hypothetical protein
LDTQNVPLNGTYTLTATGHTLTASTLTLTGTATYGPTAPTSSTASSVSWLLTGVPAGTYTAVAAGLSVDGGTAQSAQETVIIGATVSSGPAVDIGFQVGLPVLDVTAATFVGAALGTGALHVPVIATLNTDGTDQSSTILAASVRVAVTPAAPLTAEFQAGTWLSRTAAPNAGLYARLGYTGQYPAGSYEVWIWPSGYGPLLAGFVYFE